MKKLLTLVFFSFFILNANGQKTDSKTSLPDSTKKIQLLDASCGQCQLGLTGKKGCDLAVRIDGKAYFVEGTTIDEHGDAHAQDGFCESIRKAEVQGEKIDDLFKVTYFKLVKPAKEKD